MASTSVVGKTTAVPPSTLNLLQNNPRKGDVAAIMASLRRHSQYAPITVNLGTHTGRPNEVLKGNHTTLAFRQLADEEPDDARWRKILVFWIDVDDDMANRIVVADNQTGQLGGFDTAELVALLESFGDDTVGLGFTEADISDLMALHQENDSSAIDRVTGGQGGDPDPAPKANDPDNPGGAGRDDGLINAKDMSTRKDEYAEAAANRMVVLTLPIPRFVWVQEKLEAFRAESGTDTNSDAVVALLEHWSGETAPAQDAPIPEGTDTSRDFSAGVVGGWRGTGNGSNDHPSRAVRPPGAADAASAFGPAFSHVTEPAGFTGDDD